MPSGFHTSFRFCSSICLTALLLLGCSLTVPAKTPTAVPQATQAATQAGVVPLPENTSAPAQASTFTSSRHGYTITLPAGWSVQEIPGQWDGTVSALSGFPGADAFIEAADEAYPPMAIGFMPLNPGTTLDSWFQAESPRLAIRYCEPSAALEATTVAGEAGTLQHLNCLSVKITAVYLVHGSQGILITWAGPSLQTRKFRSLLDTFRLP